MRLYCTAKRVCYFGEIRNGKIDLSEIGEMAHKFWAGIPAHFPFVILDEFVIMPDHMHGIIIIDKPDYGRNHILDVNVETQNFASLPEPSTQPSMQPSPETDLEPESKYPIIQPKNKFGPQSKNLASIIRGYKTGVKKYATMNNIDFAWHPRFHDHIVRDNESYNHIRHYIIDNPENWNGFR